MNAPAFRAWRQEDGECKASPAAQGNHISERREEEKRNPIWRLGGKCGRFTCFFSMVHILQRCSVMLEKSGGQIMKIPRGKFTFKGFVYQGMQANPLLDSLRNRHRWDSNSSGTLSSSLLIT